jgi:hypothetical protein
MAFGVIPETHSHTTGFRFGDVGYPRNSEAIRVFHVGFNYRGGRASLADSLAVRDGSERAAGALELGAHDAGRCWRIHDYRFVRFGGRVQRTICHKDAEPRRLPKWQENERRLANHTKKELPHPKSSQSDASRSVATSCVDHYEFLKSTANSLYPRSARSAGRTQGASDVYAENDAA